MDRERARFPDTQDYAIVYKHAKANFDDVCREAAKIKVSMTNACRKERKAMNEVGREYNKILTDVRKTLMPSPTPPGFVYHVWYNQTTAQVVANPEVIASWTLYTEAQKVFNDKMAPYQLLARPIDQMVIDYGYAIRTYGLTHRGARGIATDEQKAPRAVFHQKCPAEQCEGFLSTQWKCGLCNGKFCKDCHETKADDHECNQDLVASVKAIKKEAKPCPKCASQISKIDGCDQMWCTQCHTAFSWNTGQIETHIVHNPHYFQWMRENGNIMPRAPGDNPDPNAACGGINRLTSRLRTISRNVENIDGYKEFVNHMLENIRCFQHYTQVDIQNYQRILNADTLENDRRILRVKRMLNEITDDVWKTTLQRSEKEQLKTQARRQLLDMYATAGMEIIGQVLNEDYDVKSICKQLSALYQFTEKSNTKIAKAYGCKPLKIVIRTDTLNVQFHQYN